MSARAKNVAPVLRSHIETGGTITMLDALPAARAELHALLAVARAAGDLSRLVYPPEVWTPNASPSANLGPGERAAKKLNAALRRLARASRGET